MPTSSLSKRLPANSACPASWGEQRPANWRTGPRWTGSRRPGGPLSILANRRRGGGRPLCGHGPYGRRPGGNHRPADFSRHGSRRSGGHASGSTAGTGDDSVAAAAGHRSSRDSRLFAPARPVLARRSQQRLDRGHSQLDPQRAAARRPAARQPRGPGRHSSAGSACRGSAGRARAFGNESGSAGDRVARRFGADVPLRAFSWRKPVLDPRDVPPGLARPRLARASDGV